MGPIKPKPRLAVVSPFLDKRHGSERITVEWLSHLPDEFDIHVYSQRVEDFDESKFGVTGMGASAGCGTI
jgi:hypothetical protein